MGVARWSAAGTEPISPWACTEWDICVVIRRALPATVARGESFWVRIHNEKKYKATARMPIAELSIPIHLSQEKSLITFCYTRGTTVVSPRVRAPGRCVVVP